jgi:hypothetical protein
MEQALPSLRSLQASGEAQRGPGQVGAQRAAPLQERLTSAVREEVEAALKSDRQLGEQVTQILAGRRFDDTSRTQVVRLIDARAQQLVPGAVKSVVGAWTQTALATRGKGENTGASAREARPGGTPGAKSGENENPIPLLRDSNCGRRLDYRKLTDEEILGL